MLRACRQILVSRRAKVLRSVLMAALAFSTLNATTPKVLAHSHEHAPTHISLDAGSLHDHDHAPADTSDGHDWHVHDATLPGFASLVAITPADPYIIAGAFARIVLLDPNAAPDIFLESFFRPPIRLSA
jgi:hypothetical protein